MDTVKISLDSALGYLQNIMTKRMFDDTLKGLADSMPLSNSDLISVLVVTELWEL